MRAGYLIVGALIFALAAAAVLIWTNQINLPGQPAAPPSATSVPSTTVAPPSHEAQLVTAMNEAAAGGGYVATFMEGDVGKWQIADGHKLERFSLGSNGPVFARFTSSTTLDKTSVQWPALGLSMTLPPEFANAVAGKKVEVGIIARAAQSNGSNELSVVYATRQSGNSGWQSIALQPNFEAYKITYDVPNREGGYTNGPMIVFHSDASGGGRAVEMIGAYLKVIP